MDLSPAIASAVAAALAVPLFLATMRRFKSLRHRPDTRKSFAQLSREYRKWEWLSLLLSILLIGVIGYPAWLLLDSLYAARLSSGETGLFLIGLPPIVWALPAFFFALFVVAIPLHYLFQALLGRRRYAEYVEYGNQKFSIDSWKLFRYLGNILLPLCLCLTLMALDTYARVTGEAFVVNRFLGIGETVYRFEQVTVIVLVKSFAAQGGDILREPYYVIRFDDGSEYDFRQTLTGMNLRRQQLLVNFLVARSNAEIHIDDPYPA